MDLTGDDEAGTEGETPKFALIVVGHAGEGAERGQVDFNGELADEPGGESAEPRRHPTPMGLV